ncbi:AmmeMemoRadiSam system protein B, partial [Candidatus Omnitrophota bacterium]
DLIEKDDLAHTFEHSIEVQLPFLQAMQKAFRIVPIVMGSADHRAYKDLGLQIARTINDLKLSSAAMMIASSDMTHYEPHDSAKEKDYKAIDAILKLDEDMLLKNIMRFDISMCGYAPTYAMIVAAKELGAKGARLVKYQTSAEASGDYSSVVGYAGIIVS